MLTKTMKFDETTLSVLRGLDWSADGLAAKITQQLDRKQYESVNKALEAMGGKWNRGAKAHLFATDPRPQVDGLLDTGALTVERDGFFETPEAVVEQMLRHVKMDDYMRVLEPSAGMGAIARVVIARVPTSHLVLIEKNSARADSLMKQFPEALVTCMDFLGQLPRGDRFDLVIMNPPFEEGQDIAHVRNAYEFLFSGGGTLIAVMSEGVFFRNDRKATEFREWLDAVGGYSEKLPEGSFRESGTGVNTRLVIIEK